MSGPTPSKPAAAPDGRSVSYWELYNGSGRLYICGPGVNAWFPVTSFSSSKIRHGTSAELHIARKALALLSLRFRDTANATPEDIRATLESCGWTPDEWTRYPISQP